MNANVDKVIYLNESIIKDFQTRKLIDEVENLDIELEPTKPGEVYLATLTPEEAKLFIATETLRDSSDQYMFERNLDARRRSIEEDSETGYKGFAPITFIEIKMTQEQAEHYYELTSRHAYLLSYFWYVLRQRINCFGGFLAIRDGLKVVRTGWKHDKPPEKK